MIVVHKAYQEVQGDNIVVYCQIDVDSLSKKIWFSVHKKYESFLTYDRGDAFLIHLLYHAMKGHHDIVFEAPISKRLLYQVKTYLIDAINKANPNFCRINIDCQTISEAYENGHAVGAGMSCGVDSLATLYSHNEEEHPMLPISQLTFFDVGGFQHDDGKQVGGADSLLFAQQLSQAEACAKQANLPLMIVRSNIGEVIPAKHSLVHSYRNCGTVLLFQKLFHTYYYSSGTELTDFVLSPEKDSAYYDLYSLQMFSTDTTRFYSYSPTIRRFEKVNAIKNYALAHQFLQVCTREGKNCGTCAKCARTLVELDALDALPDFSEVFDLSKYKKSRTLQIGYAIANCRKPFYRDSFPILKRKKKIPALSWGYAMGFILLRPLENYLHNLSPEKKRKAVALAQKLNIRVPW